LFTTYKRSLAYFLHDWPRIAALVSLIFLLVVLGTLLAWPMAILIDVVLSAKPKSGFIYNLFNQFVPQGAGARIVVLGVMFVVLKFALDLLSCFRSMISNSIKYRGTFRVRRDLFEHFHHLGVPYHNSKPMGDSLFRLSNDTFGPFGIFDTIFTTGQQTATLLTITAVMLTRSIPLTLFALALAPLMLVGNWYFGRNIKKRAEESREIDAGLLTVIQRALSSMNLIHAYDRRAHEELQFQSKMNQSVRAAMSLHWQENLYPLFIQCIYGIGQASVLCYGGYLVYQNQILNGPTEGFSYGDLLLFMGYFSQLLNPLSEVIGFSARVKTSITASERVFTVLDEVPAVSDAPDAIELKVKPRPLVLKNVSFGYEPGSVIVKGISARIEPGEMVAFIGASGSGKSTLLNLLPRFFDPTSGEITLGRRDLRRISLSSLRRHIVIVSQENALVAGTIGENIGYGNKFAGLDKIKHAAELAGAASFIDVLSDGYETKVTEGGKNFSGGQRQRIAIARALVTDAPILIFDEPTSALDAESEALVMDTINSLKGKRTVILVTHRLDTATECDSVYHLEKGRITRLNSEHVMMAHQAERFSRHNSSLTANMSSMSSTMIKPSDPFSVLSVDGT